MSAYLLFDGVLHEQVLPWLYRQDEPLEIEPLYMYTPWSELADIGPVLVQPFSADGLLRNFERDPTLHRCASMLLSVAPICELAEHLRQFVRVTDVWGSESLLRFADPLVAQHWLASYSEQALAAVLGPIDEWKLAAHSPRWQTRAQTQWVCFHARKPGASQASLKLHHFERPQIDGLEQAYQCRFSDQLDSWFEQAHSGFRSTMGSAWGDWLGRQLQAARAWGLTTERSIAIWLELHARLGDQLCDDEGKLYTAWLAENPHLQGMPADTRIQAFEADYFNRQPQGLS